MKGVEKRLSTECLVRERDLAKALAVSPDTLAKWRLNGCPWLKLEGRVFYHESEFMEWLLKTQKRVSDTQ